MKEAKDIGYFGLQDVYDSQVTDLPTCYTALAGNNTRKVIKNRHNTPPGLREFEKYFDQVLDGVEWTMTRAPSGDGH